MKEGTPLRVLFLNYEYPPLGGGAANANAYLLKAYQAHPDIQVDLVTASPDADSHITSLSPAIKVHTIGIGKDERTLHHQSHKDLLRYTVRGYKYADALLKKNKYDVIHAFFSVPCGAMALRLSKKYQLPYLVSLRGSDVPGYSERFSALYVFIRPFIRSIWRRAQAVVSNSQGLKDLALVSAPTQEIAIIPNGVDTEKFTSEHTQSPKDEWIITAGATRLTARKGLHLIIQALPELIAEEPRIVFEVMGDGSALESLQALAAELHVTDHVRFLGRISVEKTPLYYSRAKVFVLPSANEGMSNALLEGLASGLPVVVTDTGGSSELVTEGVNGFIIERSAAALKEALKKLISNEPLCATMGQASRIRAEQQSWQAVGDSYVELYRKMRKV